MAFFHGYHWRIKLAYRMFTLCEGGSLFIRMAGHRAQNSFGYSSFAYKLITVSATLLFAKGVYDAFKRTGWMDSAEDQELARCSEETKYDAINILRQETVLKTQQLDTQVKVLRPKMMNIPMCTDYGDPCANPITCPHAKIYSSAVDVSKLKCCRDTLDCRFDNTHGYCSHTMDPSLFHRNCDPQGSHVSTARTPLAKNDKKERVFYHHDPVVLTPYEVTATSRCAGGQPVEHFYDKVERNLAYVKISPSVDGLSGLANSMFHVSSQIWVTNQHALLPTPFYLSMTRTPMWV
jgi:hypothetical protein